MCRLLALFMFGIESRTLRWPVLGHDLMKPEGSMSLQFYSGGCQCGAVRYEATVDLDNTVSCNCSRCGKLGSILGFTPEENFTLLSGTDSLTEYRFNRQVIEHQFCKVCGIQPFARSSMPDGKKMVAVNVRCLDGVEPDELKPTKYDGRNH
jgi:hypothetical protein